MFVWRILRAILIRMSCWQNLFVRLVTSFNLRIFDRFLNIQVFEKAWFRLKEMNAAVVHPWEPPLSRNDTMSKICKKAKQKKNYCCIPMFGCLVNAMGRQQANGCCELACTSSSKDVFDQYSVPVSFKFFTFDFFQRMGKLGSARKEKRWGGFPHSPPLLPKIFEKRKKKRILYPLLLPSHGSKIF